MNKFKLSLLILALGLWAAAEAQYVGSSRPPSRQEMLDSLAARLDTARFTADSLRLDSLAAAGADKDVALDTRIDSVRDNPGGGSGGSAPALDTTYYDYIFGSNRQDSSSYGAFSGFRFYLGGRADSVSGDSLVAAIRALTLTGGNIALLGGDTITLVGDSLQKSDSIKADIRIIGTHPRQSHIAGWSLYGGSLFLDSVFVGATEGGKLSFENIGFHDYGARATQLDNYSVIYSWRNTNLEFLDCIIHGNLSDILIYNGCGDSSLTFTRCEFDNLIGRFYANYSFGSVKGQPTMRVDNCTGTVRDFWVNCHNSNPVYFIIDACDFRITGDGWQSSGNTSPNVFWTGSTFRIDSTAYVASVGRMGGITGCTFIWHPGAVHPYLYFGNYGTHGVTGCTFFRGGISLSGPGGNYNPTAVLACNIKGATVGIDVNAGYSIILGNALYSCTTGIDIDGTAASTCIVGGNAGYANTTDKNGTAGAEYDNNWW